MKELAFCVGILLLLAGPMYLMYWHTTTLIEVQDWCRDAGGIPITGDRGHFKVCLDPSAVIQRPQ